MRIDIRCMTFSISYGVIYYCVILNNNIIQLARTPSISIYQVYHTAHT